MITQLQKDDIFAEIAVRDSAISVSTSLSYCPRVIRESNVYFYFQPDGWRVGRVWRAVVLPVCRGAFSVWFSHPLTGGYLTVCG